MHSSSPNSTLLVPGDKELLFTALGGNGEIGRNAYLYGNSGCWIMIDLGIGFPEDRALGIDVTLPDIRCIAEQRKRLQGIFITHAHEDHIGAVARLWRHLRVPVYTSAFAGELLRARLREAKLELPLRIFRSDQEVRVGPFSVLALSSTHSIPEAFSFVVRSPAGSVFHSGDWRLDPHPLIGQPTDLQALESLGRKGILASVCDSTGALEECSPDTESSIRKPLEKRIAEAEGCVAVACFASNVARLRTIIGATVACGRCYALLGRSMRRVEAAARSCGYLEGLPPPVQEREYARLPAQRMVFLVAGSQGEEGSALWRIACREKGTMLLEEGDRVLFSSRIIPGNERSVLDISRRLMENGVAVFHDSNLHVSGHGGRPDLQRLYRLLRPEICLPVHGETGMLQAHAQLAEKEGVACCVSARNGEVWRLAPREPELRSRVALSDVAVDGKQHLPLQGRTILDRRRLRREGIVLASLCLDRLEGLSTKPHITLCGLVEEEEEDDLVQLLQTRVRKALHNHTGRSAYDTETTSADQESPSLETRIARSLRQACRSALGKSPRVVVHVFRPDQPGNVGI